MSKGFKVFGCIALLGALSITILCVAGSAYAALQLITNTNLSERSSADMSGVVVAQESIADLDLPDGFQIDGHVDVLGLQVLMYQGKSERQHIYLAQAPKTMGFGLYEVDLEKVMEEARSGDSRVDVVTRGERKTVELAREDLTVRGKPAVKVTSDVINGSGEVYRQVSVFFEGKGGPALVNMSAPIDLWDQADCDTLIASIR